MARGFLREKIREAEAKVNELFSKMVISSPEIDQFEATINAGNLEDLREHYLLLLIQADTEKTAEHQVRTLFNIARIYYHVGDNESALAALDAASEYALQLSREEMVSIADQLWNLIFVLKAQEA